MIGPIGCLVASRSFKLSFSHYEPCPKCREIGNDRAGDNLAVYHDGSAHCFSCKHHIFPKHYVQQAPKKKNETSQDLLPGDFTREVPAAGLKWLLQYELPWSYWKESIGYSPSEERLIFLVGRPHRFSIGRYLGADGKRKWRAWGRPHAEAEAIGSGEVTVIVEDLISAHKIALIPGVLALPLFGTDIGESVIKYLMTHNGPIFVWLDYDQRWLVQKQIVRVSSLLNREVKQIITEKDPKSLTLKEIENELFS